MNILEQTFDEFCVDIGRHYKKGAFHASAAYRAVFKKGAVSFSNLHEFADCRAFASRLSNDIGQPPAGPSCSVMEGALIKFASTLSDGNMIESVIIPSPDRTTLCVSSQVGCRFGCGFCATGAGGYVRDLTAGEIVAQVFSARFTLKSRVDNLVYMGMGEPLDNFNNVVQSLRVVSDQRGLDIPLRRITISTAGHADGMARLAELNLKNLRVAISINAANDALRKRLMPINTLFPLATLKKALCRYPLGARGVFFIEYVVFAGVNDSREHARQLADYVKGLPVRVNLIAYNSNAALPYVSPRPETMEQFRAWLAAEKLFVRIRRSHGQGIMAACGQLNRTARSRVSTPIDRPCVPATNGSV